MNNMRLSRSSRLEPAKSEEPTPKPASAVNPIASSEGSAWSNRGAERKAVLLEYFSNPSPEMRELHAAWDAALALYGDEDSEAWVAALEDGTHPLCRFGSTTRLA
jgi:hypothetical protein